METPFDWLSVLLFIAGAGVFFHRLGAGDEPLAPYMLISLVAAVANWTGDHGAPVFALVLLVAGAVYLLRLFRAPPAGAGSEGPGAA